MAARRPGENHKVTSANGHEIHIKYFDDGAVRFRLDEAGPMALRFAFLPGVKRNVTIELAPMPDSPWSESK